jgi:hypothetical protein
MPKTPAAARSTQKHGQPPRAERPHKTLTKTQEEIADLASDLILNGGAHEDVDLMLTALLRHEYRRFSFGGRSTFRTPTQNDQLAHEHAARWLHDRYRHLSAHWPAAKPEAKDAQNAPAPKTVAEMVRANVRGSLQNAFDEFMTDGHGIEPAWLLNEILEDANNEGDLALAIHYALDQSQIYVRVPVKHHERIQEFVEFLEEEAPRAA